MYWFVEIEYKFDVFLILNDYFVVGFLMEVRWFGYSVLEDFVICGFDNMEIVYLFDIIMIYYLVNL